MLKTAQLLKESREKKGLTLSEVSIALKINIKVLQSIENAETEKLPAKAFLRGFIKSYAQYLKINVDEVIATFNQEMGIQDTKPVVNSPAQDPQSQDILQSQPNTSAPHLTLVKKSKSQPTLTVGKQSEWSTFKKVGMSTLVIILVSLIYFIKTTIEKYEKEALVPPMETALEEKNNLPNDIPVVTEAPMTQMNSNDSATVSPTPQSVVNIPTTPTLNPQQIAVATPRVEVPVTVVKPVSTPTPAPSIAPTMTPKPITSPTPTASPTPIAKKPQEIIIEALDKVEISYTLDNGKTEVITLSADQVQTLKAKSTVKLKISNGGAVNIIQNGRDRGVPGDLGKPIQLNY